MAQVPGSVSKLTKVLAAEGINIEYMYTLSSSKEFGSMILKVSDIQKAVMDCEAAGMDIGKSRGSIFSVIKSAIGTLISSN